MSNIYDLPLAQDDSVLDATSSFEIFPCDGTAALECVQVDPLDLILSQSLTEAVNLEAQLQENLGIINDANLHKLLAMGHDVIISALQKYNKAGELKTINAIVIGKTLNFFEDKVRLLGQNWVKFRKRHFIGDLSERNAIRYAAFSRIKNVENWASLGITVLGILAGFLNNQRYGSLDDPIGFLLEKYDFDYDLDGHKLKSAITEIIFIESVIADIKKRDGALTDADLDCLDRELISKIAVESGFKPNKDSKHFKAAAREFLKGYREDNQNPNKYLESYRQNLFNASTGNSTGREPRPESFNLKIIDLKIGLDYGRENEGYFSTASRAEIEEVIEGLTGVLERFIA